MIYEVKLKEAMADVFRELIKGSAIENQLTGTVKLANEEKDPDYGVDEDVKLMSREAEQARRCAKWPSRRRRVPRPGQAAASRRIVRRKPPSSSRR